MVYDEWAETLQCEANNYPGQGYIASFTVNWLPGMATDFRDVVFSDSFSARLPFWVKSYTAGVSASFDVKLGQSSTFFLHYGNPAAVSASNGNDTFEFFEDFSSGTLDTSKWNQLNTAVIENGSCKIGATSNLFCNISSKVTFGEGYTVVMRANIPNAHGSHDGAGFFVFDAGGAVVNMIACISAWDSPQHAYSYINTVASSRVSITDYSGSYHVYEISRKGSGYTALKVDGTTVVSNQSGSYTGSSSIGGRCYEANTYTYIDYCYVKKYVATEPTITITRSLSSKQPVTFKYIIPNVTGGLYRESCVFIPSVKHSLDMVNIQLHRSSGACLSSIFEGVSYLRHCRRAASSFVDEIYSDIRQKNIAFNRKASMSTSVRLNEHRNTHSERTSGIYVHSPFTEKGSRNFYTYRYHTGQGWFIPEPVCKVTVVRHLEVNAGMSIPTPAVMVKRYYWGYVANRTSSSYIGSPNIIASCEYHLNRDALAEIPSIVINASPDSGRETGGYVSSVYVKGSRLVDNHMSSGMYLSQIGLKARFNSDIHRESSIEVYPVLSSATRSGSFNRVSGSSILIIGFGVAGEVLTDRITAVYMGDVSVKAERILHAVRESALECSEPCVIAFGATNADMPYPPFDIDIDKTDFIITVDQPEYGVVLDKGLFYAVIRDGLTMIEITQYDTDTFSANIYDTDPITGESRAMPLAGKTVKAVLKGGSPDTTVIVDCVVVEAGKVEIDLTSSDTSVVGKYFLRFVILGDGYRKEIPENRDDYLEVQINDASYPTI